MQLGKTNLIRPARVSTAIILLGVGWGIYILIVLVGFTRIIISLHDWDYTLYATRLALSITLTLSILLVIIFIFMLNRLAKGKNWARITFIVLFIILIPSHIMHIWRLLDQPIIAIADICQLVMISLALVFLFQKESNEWFKIIKANYQSGRAEPHYTGAKITKYATTFVIILLSLATISFITSYLITSPAFMTRDELNKVLLREASEGRVENVKELLRYGADINTKNEFGSTPFRLAVLGNNVAVVELLLKLGQDPNDGSSSINPLTSAAANGELELTKLLLKYGADPDFPTRWNYTALMSAVGHTDIFKILLKHNANIHARENLNGCTVLMFAAMRGTREVVEILCSLGADIKAKDNRGNTAFSLATKYNKPEVIEILKRYDSNNVPAIRKGNPEKTF